MMAEKLQVQFMGVWAILSLPKLMSQKLKILMFLSLYLGSRFCVWRIVQSENLSRTAATSIQLVPSRPLSKVTSETVEMNLLRGIGRYCFTFVYMVYIEIRDSNPYTFIYSQLKNLKSSSKTYISVQLKKFETRNFFSINVPKSVILMSILMLWFNTGRIIRIVIDFFVMELWFLAVKTISLRRVARTITKGVITTTI